MNVEQKVINELVTAVTPELWILFLQMLGTICLTLIVYQGMKNLAAYLFIRFDKELSKNVKIRTDGIEGTIKDINIRHLIILNSKGHEILVPITRVGGMIWEIVNNGTRRK